MLKPNTRYKELKDTYLFNTIYRKTNEYLEANPDKQVLRMGVGDVSLPLCDAVIKALHKAVDDQANAATFHGYMPEIGDASLRRAIEGGYEILSSPMPALLTVIDCNMPRPVNVKRLMKNKRAKTSSEIRGAFKADPAAAEAEIARLAAKGLLIEEWSAKDIEADPERIGFAGSPTKVKQVQSVILTAGDAKSVEPTSEGIAQLMHELISDHTLG